MGKADTFVYIAPFGRRLKRRQLIDYYKKFKYDEELYDDKFPYGKYKLKKEDGIRALEIAEEYYKTRLREIYAEQKELPPFEALYDEIKSECIEHDKKRRFGGLGDESPYISDLVYDGKVKYTEPYDIVWHFYDILGKLFCTPDNCVEVVETLAANIEERAYDYELYREQCSALLPYLISVTPTFVWHNGCSGVLHKAFRFSFNEQTMAWLLEENNRFALRKNGLYDFALLRGDELVYTCKERRFDLF